MIPEELEAKRAAIGADPVNFVHFHRGQRRFLDLVKNPVSESATVVEFLKGNGVGGTKAVMAAWSAIMFGTRNRDFQGPPFFGAWPFMKSARLLSTKEALKDRGPIQEALRSVFPVGKYRQGRGSGTAYYSEGTTTTGWDWDVLTYDQSVLQAAGANKGLIIFVEPPPRGIFYESVTRLRGSGMVLVDMTQLDMASFNEDLVDAGALMLDGRKVGEVRVAYADVEDACREHSDGHRAHSAIEADVALWPAEEREARRTGKPMHLSGRIYPNWGEPNELKELPEWHNQCVRDGKFKISSVIDPADRKPWACTWWATFPNEDVVALCEWPTFNFRECKSSPISDVERYRDVLLETEAALGLPNTNRIIDGLFGAAIKSGRGLNIIQMLGAPCVGCEEAAGITTRSVGLWGESDEEPAKLQAVRCPHRLRYKQAPAYDGSVRDGHILVRSHIGENGARPKMYALKDYTPNLCFGMRRYAWKENAREDRGLSEKPELVHKDFPDTARMLMQSKGHIWPSDPSPTKIIPMRKRRG